jgi:hypothetical protein
MEQQGGAEGPWGRALDLISERLYGQFLGLSARLAVIEQRLQERSEQEDSRMAKLEAIAHRSPCEPSKRHFALHDKADGERKEVVLRYEARKWQILVIVITAVLSFGFSMLLTKL